MEIEESKVTIDYQPPQEREKDKKHLSEFFCVTRQQQGRPTLYKPDMCAKMIAVLAEGGSVAKVCATLGITRRTFYSWLDTRLSSYQPDFAHNYYLGLEMSQAHWEDMGIANIIEFNKKAKFNTQLWQFIMKNRFPDYRNGDVAIPDHILSQLNNIVETSDTPLAEMTDEQLNQRLSDKLSG